MVGVELSAPAPAGRLDTRRVLGMKHVKKLALWGGLALLVYLILGYHFLLIDNSPVILKKSEYTLHYTFFSSQGKTNAQILAVDELREDGIADVLVDVGRMTEEEKDLLLVRYEESED
jgi:hypothetical protein